MKTLKYLIPAVCCTLLFARGTDAQEKLYPNEFPLKDVTLTDGIFKHAVDLNVQTLLKYDTDRLLAGFRKQAGLPAKAKIYPNWEGLDGHVGGHYVSALAISYASTGNAECKRRLDYMITELKACQDANGIANPEWGKGYLGAVPNGTKIWSTLQKGDFVAYRAAWVPWYNVHKMYAGLRDAWAYADNEEAKTLFLRLCDWGIAITASLNEQQMQSVLDAEQGGMNEVFADAYKITQNKKYLDAAVRFSHKMLLNSMAAGIDDLDNKHANTQVPKAVGFERIAEFAQNPEFARAGSFFWETVTANRSLAFGGNSRREWFPSVSASAEFATDVEGPESCNSYNMLKLTEHLFRMNPLAKYADFFEKTLYNHILSTQHPVHGGYVYFTPARPRHYRVYSTPNEGMWCCVGSGMESHSKYAQFIYTHSHDSLFVNLFVPSKLNWKEKGVTISQQTLFPAEGKTNFTVTQGSAKFKLMLRYPFWVTDGTLKVTVNGKSVLFSAHPSSYVAIDRTWKKGDVVQLLLPMHNSIVKMPNVPEYIAMMHGPILLGAKTGTEDLVGLTANDSRWGHIASGKKLPINKAPILIADDPAMVAAALRPMAGKPLNFQATNLKMANAQPLVLEPFYAIHDARYMMYWMTLSNGKYEAYADLAGAIESEKLALEKRAIDFVAPGEQQPEVDHAMQRQSSNTGNTFDEFWRDARNGGYFSYNLSTKGETALSLMVRYWGAENGGRKFDIYVDDEKLVSEDLSGKWNQQKFQNVEYKIPESMVKNKSQVRIKFQALSGSTAGPIYYVRLLK